MNLWRRVFEERRRTVLALVIVILANLAVLVVAVLPLQATVGSAQSEALAVRLELASTQKLERQARDARASKERATTELKNFYEEILPADAASAQKITSPWLNEAARSAGLVFKGARFTSSAMRESRLSRASAKVTLQGRYPNIRRFLYELETAKEFIVVEKVELAQPDQLSSGGLLEISLDVATYFLTPAGR